VTHIIRREFETGAPWQRSGANRTLRLPPAACEGGATADELEMVVRPSGLAQQSPLIDTRSTWWIACRKAFFEGLVEQLILTIIIKRFVVVDRRRQR